MSTDLPLLDSARMTARITWASVGVASVLVVLKTTVWLSSGSIAMMATAADSGLDLLAALGTFWAVRYAVLPPDRVHRFGHGKAEAFAAMLQAGFVCGSAALIGRAAIQALWWPRAVPADRGAMVVMFVSIVMTAGLVAVQTAVIRRTRSIAVRGDRAHYLSDLVSNGATVAGLWLVRVTGDARWDAFAGLLVAVWLLRSAVTVFRGAADELLDREVMDADRRELLRLAMDDRDVLGIHQFRTRAAGPTLHVQMHMELEPLQSLAQAHEIVERAEQRILTAFPGTDLVIHADPFGISEEHDADFDDLPVGRIVNDEDRASSIQSPPDAQRQPVKALVDDQ